MAAASFADELNKWHKQLQTIEAVLITWLTVQQLWVQLEEVGIESACTFMSFPQIWFSFFQIWFQSASFVPNLVPNTSLPQVYHSSDIQQHLSSYAFTFSNADREFRELMTLTARNPAVLAICLKQGQLVM